MVVVSLNTWGGRCEDALFSWLKSGNADIYCFQELFSGPALVKENQYQEDDDGQRVNLRLFEDIAAILPGYTTFFSGGSQGYVNDSQWLDLPFEYGIGIFIRSTIEIDRYAAGMVHSEYRQHPVGVPPLSRSAQVLRCKSGDSFLTVGNIHGLWDPRGKMDTPERKIQADRFGKLIDSTAQVSDGIMACGDFNLLMESDCFVASVHGVTVNQIQRHAIPSTRSALYTKPMRFADYIITNENVRITRLDVPQHPIVSDHCPLIAHIELV